jgi:hypothetical protein
MTNYRHVGILLKFLGGDLIESNLKINKAPGEDIIAELIKNASQELKKRFHALIYKIW